MLSKTPLFCAAALLLAAVSAGCLWFGVRFPAGPGYLFTAMRWVLLASWLLPWGVCHAIAACRIPVCRFGTPVEKGNSLNLMFAILVIVAAGGLAADAAAAFWRLGRCLGPYWGNVRGYGDDRNPRLRFCVDATRLCPR